MKRTFSLALVLLVVVGCAGKTTPLQVAALSHDSLAVAQDLEAQLCWGVADAYHAPADPTHCTAPVAATIGLTDARHQAINAKLHQAFDLHRSVTALAAAGAPTDAAALTAVIADVLAIIGQLQQTPQVAQLTAAVKAGGQ